MTRRRITPRKLLVASVGVATLNYLGVAPTACGGTTIDETKEGTGGNAGAGGSAGAAGSSGKSGGSGAGGKTPPSPTVANLMAPPPSPTVANLMAPPPFPTVANLMAPPPPFPTVANLMAPPPPPPIVDASTDTGPKRDGGAAKDAASEGD
jgi:hypothetical protein